MIGIRLGLHYHLPAEIDPDGLIRMQGAYGRFVDSMAPLCESVVCFQHTSSPSDELGSYRLQSSNVELVGIGPHCSIPRRMLHSRAMIAPVRSWRNRLDAFLIRAPTPLVASVADAVESLPTSLLLVGDYVAGVGALPQPGWRKRLIGLWSKLNKRSQDRIAKKSLVFVNSRVLHDEYSEKANTVIEIRTATLNSDEVLARHDACSFPPFRILYVGRLDTSKGLMDIALAVKRLREKGFDCIFELVGATQRGDDIPRLLEEFAKDTGIPVLFHGYRELGPELFQCYSAADVFVLASKASEGFPRTIWEAMAFSVPVVATNVGSIPHCLRDEKDALIVEPNDPAGLSGAIVRLIRDETLRKRLVANGMRLAQGNTLGKRAGEMIQEIEDWVRAK